jgi:hypothetical protein
VKTETIEFAYMGTETIAYPSQYETEILLKYWPRLRLRPIRKEDAEAWMALVSRLSLHAKYLRFHHVPKVIGIDGTMRFRYLTAIKVM